MYKYQILNFIGGFAPFTITALQNETDTDGASISDGADADDMAKMNPRNNLRASGLMLGQKLSSMGLIVGIKKQIENAIKKDLRSGSTAPTKITLYSVILRKNKLDPNYLKFIEVNRVHKVTDIHQARSIARQLQNCGSSKGYSCIRPDTDGTLGAYNIYIFILVTKP